MSTLADRAAHALRVIPADDRDLWVRVGMALKALLGDQGRDLWHEWSRTSERYRERDADAVWRSISEAGGITGGTLFALAHQHGWDSKAAPQTLTDAQYRARVRLIEEAATLRRARADKAAGRALARLQAAVLVNGHRYLAGKGFPGLPWLQCNGDLVVPMRAGGGRGEVRGLQLIAGDGAKKYWPTGCRISRCWYDLGARRAAADRITWIVEGLATGLSVHAALAALGRITTDCVRIAFSAGQVPAAYRAVAGRAAVIVDHDESRAGEDALRRSKARHHWMPPQAGDANDFMLRFGPDALANALRPVVREVMSA